MLKRFKNFRFALVSALLLFCAAVQAQTISGNVKDSNGEPIIGATVMEQGTTNGTVTDFDGNFTLKLQKAGNLNVSYVGMKSQVVKTAGKSSVNVKLEDDNTTLNDLVVVGYGTMKKKDLTGSVATVNSDALTAVPVASATEALQGKMAGVNITTSEGSPDADVKIRVRGGGSITGDNTPLFIVDGFPVESISDIPSSDIEDITVLKDASSTAIYGSRGANGVILVTTKSGKEGKIKVSYNAYYSWKKMAKQLNTLSSADYVNWQWELTQLRAWSKGSSDLSDYTSMFGDYATDHDLYANAPTNNWQDQVFGKTGHTFNHNLSINGGGEKTKYSFGYAHMNDDAIMVGSSFKRDNLSFKLNHKANDKVSLDFSVRYSNVDIDGAGANESKNEVSSADSRLKDVMIYPMFNFPDLSDGYDEDLQLTNPLSSTRDNDRRQSRQTFDLNGAFTWQIIKGLKFKTEFGLQHYYNSDRRYYGTSTYNSRTNGGGMPMANFIDSTRKTFRNTNTLNYDFKNLIKSKDHNLNLLVGQEMITKSSNTNTVELYNFPEQFTAYQTWTLTSQGQTRVNPDYYANADDNLLSFFSRLNYDYQSKYLLSATVRADGSSKFAEGHRWGWFPSVALGWRISSENFMKATEDWLDDLKLRVSYGTAGNNNIPSDQITTVWSSGSTPFLNNSSVTWSANSTQMPNKDLTWETTITRNVGLDFTLFRGKLNGSVEAYWNSTKDLLINFPVTGTGYTSQYRNLGETKNTGVEVSLTWHAINKKDYGLDITGNIGFNKNEVVSLGGLESISASSGWASTQIKSDYIVKVGDPIGQIYGYKCIGRYEVSDFSGYDAISGKWTLKEGVVNDADVIGASYLRPGALKLADTDGDNNVTTADQVKIGDTNPTATGGFAINAHAYGFDFAANFTYSIGNKVYNANKIEYTTSGTYKYRNMLDVMAEGNRWTNLDPETGLITNDATRLAELNANTSLWSPYMNQNILTDWAIEDGSFLRLNTLTLGYTLPTNLVKKIWLSSLRFYVTCNNVFCWTKYSGFDPEVSTRNKTALTPGVDYSAYPKSRSFVIGVNVNF